MLNYNKKITDRFVFNIFNDVVDMVNTNLNLRDDVDGDILRIVVMVEDKNSNLTSFSLECKDL